MEITPDAESTKASDAKYNIISQRLELTLFNIWLTMSACTTTSGGACRSRGWCCNYKKSSKQGGW
jgi:hypothetical protein